MTRCHCFDSVTFNLRGRCRSKLDDRDPDYQNTMPDLLLADEKMSPKWVKMALIRESINEELINEEITL